MEACAGKYHATKVRGSEAARHAIGRRVGLWGKGGLSGGNKQYCREVVEM